MLTTIQFDSVSDLLHSGQTTSRADTTLHDIDRWPGVARRGVSWRGVAPGMPLAPNASERAAQKQTRPAFSWAFPGVLEVDRQTNLGLTQGQQ